MNRCYSCTKSRGLKKKLMYRTTPHLQVHRTTPPLLLSLLTITKLSSVQITVARQVSTKPSPAPATLPRSHHPGGDATVRLTTAGNMRRHIEGPAGGVRGRWHGFRQQARSRGRGQHVLSLGQHAPDGLELTDNVGHVGPRFGLIPATPYCKGEEPLHAFRRVWGHPAVNDPRNVTWLVSYVYLQQ